MTKTKEEMQKEILAAVEELDAKRAELFDAIEADARAELIEAHKTGDTTKSILVYHDNGTIERLPLANPSEQKAVFDYALSIYAEFVTALVPGFQAAQDADECDVIGIYSIMRMSDQVTRDGTMPA